MHCTLDAYLLQLPAYGRSRLTLDQRTCRLVSAWLPERGLAFVGFADDAGYAGTDAGCPIRRARCSPPPPGELSDDERRQLLAALDEASTPEEVRDRALVRLLLEAGLRVGSAVALDVEDLDLDGGDLRLRCMKGDRFNTRPLPSPERQAPPGSGAQLGRIQPRRVEFTGDEYAEPP